MAIIIQEERNTSGVMSFLAWIVILGIIGGGIYYVFFKKPDLIEVVAPGSFQSTQEISKINLDAGRVVNDPHFQALRSHVTPRTPATPGRANPFLGF